jgi:hypothetical protein
MDTTNNTYRMPTLASSVIDTTGSGVVGYWIDNMNPASPSVVTHSQFVDWMPHH